MTAIKVLIIEDEPPIARNLQQILTAHNYQVVGIAYDVTAAYDKLSQQLADLVLLDINLNGQFSGLDIAQVIHDKYHVPFIFITSYADPATIEKAKTFQPVGYVVKPFTDDEIYAAIEIGWYNHSALGPDNLSIEFLNARLQEPLTEREFELLHDVTRGESYKDIARKHFISVNTVSTHIKKIYAKMHVHSRGALTQYLRTL